MGTLLDGIVDDAALFPPARTPMGEALPAHRAVTGRRPVGRFLCPASRLDELRRHLVPEDLLDLAIVADTGVEALPTALETARREPRVRLYSVELAPDPDADQARAAAVMIARLPTDLPCLIEIRQGTGWRATLDRLAAARRHGARLGAKLRTGGGHIPSPEEVAAFVAACAERDLPFKCTAGLHHAIRRTDPATGRAHHGFLNILLAACRARSSPANLHAIEDALTATDPTALATEVTAIDEPTAHAVRALFTGFGSCDVRTPLADLTRLGLTDARTPAR